MCEVTPVVTEVAGIAEDAVNNRAQIELCAECVEHGVAVDAGNGLGRLVCLKQVSALGGFMDESTMGYSFTVCLSTWTFLRGQGTNMKFALRDLEQLSDMVANFKQQLTVLKGNGGQPGTG